MKDSVSHLRTATVVKQTMSSATVLNVSSAVAPAVAASCNICCDPFTKHLRKPIVCPVSKCGYSACHTCYKTFLTTDGVTASKCMQCNTEFTLAFLKQHFAESFIKKDLRQKFTDVLVQRQVAQLPLSQPNAERELMAREKNKEIARIDELIKSLTIQKKILQDDVRFLRNSRNHASDGDEVATFQRKCCDPACPGFVSASWKCGICNKFSCTHCHEVKGATREEVEAHVCNPETVESIKFLKADTKPCPSCGTYIHKTEGCDQMFCTSCKQLWSWNTGRIETRGHNPHYLEWMRSRGELERDPQDVQCGREIDRGFLYQVRLNYSKLLVRSPTEEIREKMHSVFEKEFPEIARSILHLRLNDIPRLQAQIDVEPRAAELRVGYLCKDFDMASFRRRVFKIYQTAEVSRNVLDLLAAVQNASTDILYRALDLMQNLVAQGDSGRTWLENEKVGKYCDLLNTMTELEELRNYAIGCIDEIYTSHSISTKRTFGNWFALLN